MNCAKANSKQLNILGRGDCSSDQEIFTATLRKWGQRLGYCSIVAAVPAVLASQVPVARSDDANKPTTAVAGERLRFLQGLNKSGSNPTLLKKQSEFLLPHQKGNFAMLAALAGNDDCPGRTIPGGTYTAAAPYTDSGDTTGANNTVAHLTYYYYYNLDAEGPDLIYSFTLIDRGPNASIQVSTPSGTYRPLIYVLQGGFPGGCPVSVGNTATNVVATAGGSSVDTATINMSYLPVGVPLYLFVDSFHNDANGSGPYTLRMQDVTIAGSTCANPIDCPEVFVRTHYADFLNREPDPAGFAGWMGVLSNCVPGDTSCDRIHVSSAFFRSPEFQGRGYLIYRFYPVALGRKPDYDEFRRDQGWVTGFLSDADLRARMLQFLSDFMRRPEFVARYNALSNAEYVDRLLATAGITHPSRDFWIASLNNGSKARYEVMREICESTEVYNKYYNQAFVVMQYFGYLHRQPDALYLNWISYLDATGDYRGMINGFVNSLEYRNRFAQP